MKKWVWITAIIFVNLAAIAILAVVILFGGPKEKSDVRKEPIVSEEASKTDEVVSKKEESSKAEEVVPKQNEETVIATEEVAEEEQEVASAVQEETVVPISDKEMKELLLANQTEYSNDIIDIGIFMEQWDTKDTEYYSIVQIDSRMLSFDENGVARYTIKEPGTYRIHCSEGKVDVGFGDTHKPIFEGNTDDGYSFVVMKETELELSSYYSDGFVLYLERLSAYDWVQEAEIDVDNAFSIQEKEYFSLKDTVKKDNAYLCIDAIDVDAENHLNEVVLGLHVSLVNGSGKTLAPSYGTKVDGEVIYSSNNLRYIDGLETFSLYEMENGTVERGYLTYGIPIGAKELIIRFYFDYNDEEYVEYRFDISEITDLKAEIFE